MFDGLKQFSLYRSRYQETFKTGFRILGPVMVYLRILQCGEDTSIEEIFVNLVAAFFL